MGIYICVAGTRQGWSEKAKGAGLGKLKGQYTDGAG